MHRILTLFLISISTNSFGQNFSYDYVELGPFLRFTDGTYTDKYYKGIALSGRKSLNKNLFLNLSYTNTEDDWRDPGEHEEQRMQTFLLGIGSNIKVTDFTDLILEVNRVHQKHDWKQISPTTRSITYEDDYFLLTTGLRSKLTERTSIEANFQHATAGSLNTDLDTLMLSAEYQISNTLSLNILYHTYAFPINDDYWDSSIALRYYF